MTEPKNAGRRLKNVRWKVHDLIDLEYFLHRKIRSEDNDDIPPLDVSDRGIYLSLLKKQQNRNNTFSRRFLIKSWLDARREGEKGSLPGSIFGEVQRVAILVAVLLGIASGIGLAFSLLDYTGAEPLNVSVYLGAAVFSQMLLLVLLAAVLSIRTATGSLVRRSVLAGLLGKTLAKAILRARQGARNTMDGKKREAVAAAAGLLRGRRQIYGTLFFWPLFVVIQIFGVCFNIGLLGATLLRLSGSDVAFGWQSTFQVSADAVFRMVQAISLPWREFLPAALAHPSMAQIEGSHIVLKEGIYHLATENLVSWWPFLCLSVLFYGLLPRVFLLLSGIAVQSFLLARLNFDHGACDALIQRMVSPELKTTGEPSSVSDPEASFFNDTVHEPGKPVSADMDRSVVVLVPDDIFDSCEGMDALLERRLAFHVVDRKRIGTEFLQDQAVLDSLGESPENTGPRGVLLLQEAWQPPIQETVQFLVNLRHKIGETAPIVVGLIGKPAPDTIFTPVREEDRRVWKRKLDALGDPYLRMEALVIHDV